MTGEPDRRPEIPYPFGPGREVPQRTEPVLVPIVDVPAGQPADRLFERRTILVAGALDSAAVTALCAQLMALDGRSADDVELIVNSPGGSIAEVAAVLDVMELMRATVNVTCAGMAQGTAAVLIACASGNRRAGPNTRIRLRVDDERPTTASAEELTRVADERAMRRRQLVDAMCHATGRPAQVIERELDAGEWHDAAGARELGLIDEIIEPRRRR